MNKPAQHKLQAPKGTRDWYPPDMAVRRHIERVWREVSINHGFEEVDGPTFEHTDLYTVKSGPGIVSEIFGVFSGKDKEELEQLKQTGQSPYALRPEFTPTLARMYAAQAGALPRPTKWFSIPNFFRAERPQRGRLREFQQWNVDILGDESPQADAEVIAVAIGMLEAFRITPQQARIKIGHRLDLSDCLRNFGVSESKLLTAFDMLDAVEKEGPDGLRRRCTQLGLSEGTFDQILNFMQLPDARANAPVITTPSPDQPFRPSLWGLLRLDQIHDEITRLGIDHWCDYRPSLARGLAYYTGTVFEIHEASGQERAIAGGGRYDKLVELFGGPPTPACGFAMGDVVLTNILRDKGLLTPAEEYLPRPDAFIIAADDDAAAKLPGIVAALRRENLHVRHSYKSTRNVGKLLADASKCRARFAVILGKELAEQRVALKNLESGEQREVNVDGLVQELRAIAHS